MRMRDDPAGGAAHHLRPDGFDLNPKPRVVALDTDHVKPGQAQQKVAALAVTAGRTAAGSRSSSRSSESSGVVTPILEGLDPPSPHRHTRHRIHTHPTLRHEEPDYRRPYNTFETTIQAVTGLIFAYTS